MCMKYYWTRGFSGECQLYKSNKGKTITNKRKAAGRWQHTGKQTGDYFVIVQLN